MRRYNLDCLKSDGTSFKGDAYIADEVDEEIVKLRKVVDAALYFVKEEPIERSYSAPARVLLDALEGM